MNLKKIPHCTVQKGISFGISILSSGSWFHVVVPTMIEACVVCRNLLCDVLGQGYVGCFNTANYITWLHFWNVQKARCFVR